MEYLIPHDWFVGLHWWLLLVITLGAMLLLIKGADWLVEGASGLAYRMGMPKVIVGATIVSLGTTSPECAVSVMAAWQGNAGLALGNAVGSIIADTALIFGLGCVLTTLPADRFVLNRQGWVQLGTAALLAGVCYFVFLRDGPDAALGRTFGVMMLALLAGYMFMSVRWAKVHPSGEPFQTPDEVADETPVTPATVKKTGLPKGWDLALMMLMGLAIVIVASHVLILSVSELANQLGIPQVVIAATLVAVGTSLPELVVGMMSIRRGHPELLVGNVIGADILNVLFVTGAAAAAAPLPVVDATSVVPNIFLYLHLPAMLIVLVLFRLYIFGAVKRGSFRKWQGWPLLALYVAYVVAQYVVTAG